MQSGGTVFKMLREGVREKVEVQGNMVMWTSKIKFFIEINVRRATNSS